MFSLNLSANNLQLPIFNSYVLVVKLSITDETLHVKRDSFFFFSS